MLKTQIQFNRTCSLCKKKWQCRYFEPNPDKPDLALDKIIGTICTNYEEQTEEEYNAEIDTIISDMIDE